MNPNQIRGEVRFTNSDPSVLEILEGEGFVSSASAQIKAESVHSTPSIESTTTPSVHSALSADYEVTVEAGEIGQGIGYQLVASMQLDDDTNTYLFGSATRRGVEEEPSPDVELDLEECAGIFKIRWQDASGLPHPVLHGSIRALREVSVGTLEPQAFGVLDYLDQSQEHLAVRGDGANYLLDIRYSILAAGEPVTLVCSTEKAVSCDEIVEVSCEVPDIDQLGRIVGEIDILGETERAQASVRSIGGPYGNSRRDFLSTPLEFNEFAIEGLLPSDLVEPAVGFNIESRVYLRHGWRYEFLALPSLGLGQNAPIFVAPGETVDLEQTLVVDPGYLHGSVVLQGPVDARSESCLTDLYRFPMDGPDALPPSPVLEGSSYIEAVGSDEMLSGTSKSAAGGLARALFEGEFDSSSGSFRGDYDLVLGGLNSEDSLWTQRDLILHFDDLSTTEEAFQNSHVKIQNRKASAEPFLISSGAAVENSLDYCFSQVSVRYSSRSSQFYRPSLSAVGRFTGQDFAGHESDYFVVLNQQTVAGTPSEAISANDRGRLNLCLPQASYEMQPFVRTVDPSGGASSTELSMFELKVGCGQTIEIDTDLQLQLDPLPACSSDPIRLTGTVKGTREIARISAAVDGTPQASFCQDCGFDPTYDFIVEPNSCNQQITVLAQDVEGNRATVSQQVRFDDLAPKLSGCEDLEIDVDQGALSVRAFFDVRAEDRCDGARSVQCDHLSGDLFELGSTTVTCRASDTCGQVAECSFEVEVKGCQPARVYGVHDHGLSDSQIFWLDLESAETAALGPLRAESDLEALEVHPQTGVLYTVAARLGELYEVDKRSGELTRIGRIPNVRKHREIASLAFHPDGTLWAYHKNIGLVTLDLEDASSERQWYHPVASEITRKWDALAWDPAGRFLWGIEQRNLYRWDPKTRSVQSVCGPDFLPGKTEALDFNLEGAMLAGWHEPNDAALHMIVIDPMACTISPSRFDIPFSDIESLAWEACPE